MCEFKIKLVVFGYVAKEQVLKKRFFSKFCFFPIKKECKFFMIIATQNPVFRVLLELWGYLGPDHLVYQMTGTACHQK